MKNKKIYCYIDETGQDTKGKFYIVSVILVEQDKDLIEESLEKIEKQTGKGKTKWIKSDKAKRKKYIKAIFTSGLNLEIYYCIYAPMKEYVFSTIKALVKVIKKVEKNHINS